MDIEEVFAKKVKETRKARGYTQEKLAEACGVSQTAISKIEQGDNGVSFDLAAKIIDFLGVDPTGIFHQDKDEDPKDIPLGQIIHDARKRKGLTQMELAHLCNISTSMVSHVENNDCGMSLDLYVQMSKVLDLNVGSMCTVTNQKSLEFLPYLDKADVLELAMVRRILGMPDNK